MMNTVDYYNKNSDEFFETTAFVDMDELYLEFERLLPKGAKLLDAGCGSGRDVKHFVSMGYSVDAFDASSEMVRRARKHSGVEVRQMQFSDINAVEKYDGIWCCASLLHVPKDEMPIILNKLWTALVPNGVCYASFKYGESARTHNDRFFNDYTPDAWTVEVGNNSRFVVEKLWVTNDNRPNRSDRWVNSILRKATANTVLSALA